MNLRCVHWSTAVAGLQLPPPVAGASQAQTFDAHVAYRDATARWAYRTTLDTVFFNEGRTSQQLRSIHGSVTVQRELAQTLWGRALESWSANPDTWSGIVDGFHVDAARLGVRDAIDSSGLVANWDPCAERESVKLQRAGFR